MIAVLLALGLGTGAQATVVLGDSVVRLVQAELRVSNSIHPPSETSAADTVQLPDTWPSTRYAIGDNGWYRFDVSRTQAPDAIWGIYIPRLTMNAAVYFNGELLGDGGNFSEPLARNWARPLYFDIPSSLWRDGENRIDIRLRSYPGSGLLGSVLIGPQALLQPRYEWVYFFQVQLSAGLFLATLGASVFAFGLWRKRPGDRQYLWFAVAAFAWSLLSSNNFISHIPMPSPVWEWLMFSSIAWWTTALGLFVHRMLGKRYPRIDSALVAYAVLAMVLYALAGEYLALVAAVWMLGSVLIGGYLVWRLLQVRASLSRIPQEGAWRVLSSPQQIGLLALGITAVLLAGVHDWLVQNGFIGADREYGHHLIHYSAALLILFIAWHLIQRFITALNESEQLNAELEARVAANRRELEANYLHLQTLDQARAVAGERERIYRDLHDDVGAKLLSLVYRAGDRGSADLARSALQDLRDVVSHTQHEQLTLEEALADWHVECDQRLGAAYIQLDWRQADALPERILGQKEVVNLGRILREAISNAMQHAKPQRVVVNIDYVLAHLVIEVRDDGVGRAQGDWKPGRGLRNMELRAGELGGSLRWQDVEPQGCSVQCRIPLS
jgi:signal transduction histidine kinase